jgi:hypothetical protein
MENLEKTTGKKGRPVVTNSKRQATLAARAARVAAGGTVKRGRPTGTKNAPKAESAE